MSEESKYVSGMRNPSTEGRVERLRNFMGMLNTLYELEPDLLGETDWNSNEDACEQMVQLIREGAV